MNGYWNFITVAHCPHDAAHGELGEASLGLVSVQPKRTRRTVADLGDTGSLGGEAREERERTFAINWRGVYFCARTFLPLLIAGGDGVLVNTSSVAGFWPTAGPGAPPITAYSTSEFVIKGSSEALIEELRCNAPQVRVVMVMPGVVTTDIGVNSRRALGLPAWKQLRGSSLIPSGS